MAINACDDCGCCYPECECSERTMSENYGRELQLQPVSCSMPGTPRLVFSDSDFPVFENPWSDNTETFH